jgi:hypothetical protein
MFLNLYSTDTHTSINAIRYDMTLYGTLLFKRSECDIVINTI